MEVLKELYADCDAGFAQAGIQYILLLIYGLNNIINEYKTYRLYVYPNILFNICFNKVLML